MTQLAVPTYFVLFHITRRSQRNTIATKLRRATLSIIELIEVSKNL